MTDPDAASQTNDKPEVTTWKGDTAEAATQESGMAEATTQKGGTGETAPQKEGDPKPQVQYVLSGQPTGLAAMANAVREYDDERVNSCKEDIDTLLVFVRTLQSLSDQV